MQMWLAAAVVATLAFPGPTRSAQGGLDPSFGEDGVVTTDVGRHAATANVVLVQQDGRIVLAGEAGFRGGFAMVRYRTDGSLDRSFGSDGQVMTRVGSDATSGAQAAAVDAEGRIVAVGEAAGRFMVVRHLASGRLDRSFGTGGTVVTAVGSSGTASAVAIQADGKILVGGFSSSATGGEYHAALVRYHPDGTVDRAFGDGGQATIEQARYCGAGITALALQGDGNVVAAGCFDGDRVMLARFLPDGTLDQGFATGGIVTAEAGVGFRHVAAAVQGDGRILVALAVRGTFVVRRYGANGRLDEAFGDGGTSTSSPLGGAAFVRSLVVRGDGSVTVAGLAMGDRRSRLAVVRYLGDGAPDASFGSGGTLTARTAFGVDVAIGSSGEFIVAGSSLSEVDHTNQEFAVARYLPDGSADPGFGSGGSVRTEIAGGEDHVTAIASRADGKILVGGWTSGGLTDIDFALARYLADGSLDPSFGVGGRARIDTLPEDARGGDPSDDRANAMALQPDGKIVLAGATHQRQEDMLLARLTPSGALDPSFGRAGRVTYGTSDDEWVTAVALQRNGRIVVAGPALDGGTDAGLMLLRLMADGKLDSTFGDAGRVRDRFAPGDTAVNAIAIDANGAILVAGSARDQDDFITRPALSRYKRNGPADRTFGNLGKVVTDVGSSSASLSAIALQRGRGIVAVGHSEVSDDFLVLRYRSNGRLDTRFGNGGVASAGFPGGHANAVAIAADGKILVGGSSTVGGVSRFALARFLANGSLDAGFGSGGRIVTALGKGAAASALALAPSGGVLLAGSVELRRGPDFAVARYLGEVEQPHPAR